METREGAAPLRAGTGTSTSSTKRDRRGDAAADDAVEAVQPGDGATDDDGHTWSGATLLLVVVGATLLGAFNWWAAHLTDERLRKRVFFVQMMAVLEVVLYVSMRYYVYPVLVVHVAWGSRGVQAWLTRGLVVLGACAMAMYPLMRGLAQFLPVADEPPAAQLAVFSAFGVVLVLAMVTAVGDVAERVAAAGLAVIALACCRGGGGGAQPPASRHEAPAPQQRDAAVRSASGSTRRRTAGPTVAAAEVPEAAPPPPPPPPPPPRVLPTAAGALWATVAWRRQRSARWALTVLAATTSIVVPALLNARASPRVVEVTVPLLRLPPSLDGYRIVQLSDVHAGPTVGASQVRQLVDLANRLRGDMVVLTGDVIDGDEAQYAGVVAPLAGLTAPEVYFCSGNHDSYDGSYPAKVRILESLGVRVLHNAAVAVPAAAAAPGGSGATFDLLGVGDWSAAVLSGREWAANLTAAATGLDATRESILLAHQPKHMAETRRLGIGLQLSGHTHGGQIAPLHIPVYLGNPFFAGYYVVPTPASANPARLADLVAQFQARVAAAAAEPPALRAHPDADAVAKMQALWRALAAGDWPTQLYVSRGSAYWGPPMRFLAPQEVTVVTLRSIPALLQSQLK